MKEVGNLNWPLRGAASQTYLDEPRGAEKNCWSHVLPPPSGRGDTPRGVELDEEVVLGGGDGVEGALRQDHHVRREDEGQEGGNHEEEPGDAAQAHGNRDSCGAHGATARRPGPSRWWGETITCTLSLGRA